MPQPNLVPVNPRFSRSTQSNGVSAATLTVCSRRLTRSRIIDATSLGKSFGQAKTEASTRGDGQRLKGNVCRMPRKAEGPDRSTPRVHSRYCDPHAGTGTHPLYRIETTGVVERELSS